MIEFGELTKEEIPSLLRLYEQLTPLNKEIELSVAHKIWDEIKKQNMKYFIARENGQIISSCYIFIIPNLTRGGRSIGLIENVVTDEAYRRRGIGKRIIEMAVAYAKEQRCYKVQLQSGNARTAAHRFYESLGFDGASKKAFEMRL